MVADRPDMLVTCFLVKTTSMTLNLKNRGFWWFFSNFQLQTVNCDETDGDRPKELANKKCYKLLRVSWALAQLSCPWMLKNYWQHTREGCRWSGDRVVYRSRHEVPRCSSPWRWSRVQCSWVLTWPYGRPCMTESAWTSPRLPSSLACRTYGSSACLSESAPFNQKQCCKKLDVFKPRFLKSPTWWVIGFY